MQLLSRPSLNDPESHALFPLSLIHILALPVLQTPLRTGRRAISFSASSLPLPFFIFVCPFFSVSTFSSAFLFSSGEKLFYILSCLPIVSVLGLARPFPTETFASVAVADLEHVDDLPTLVVAPPSSDTSTTKDKDDSERSCSACSSSLEPSSIAVHYEQVDEHAPVV